MALPVHGTGVSCKHAQALLTRLPDHSLSGSFPAPHTLTPPTPTHPHPPTPRSGDLSDEFRLASFFPQPLQPPVDQLSAACTRLTGLGAASSGQQQPASYHYGLGGSVLPGTEDSDAARRRCATRAWGLLPGGSGLAAERCLSSSKAAGCEWLAPLPRHRVACRERGAKALEERLGMKKAGSAASVPPAAAAAAGSTAAQEAAPAAKAAAAAGDVEAGAAAETAS
jgi:hypothetical protein